MLLYVILENLSWLEINSLESCLPTWPFWFHGLLYPAGAFSFSCSKAVCLNGPLMESTLLPLILCDLLALLHLSVSVSSSGKMVLVLSTSRTIGRDKGCKKCYVLEQRAYHKGPDGYGLLLPHVLAFLTRGHLRHKPTQTHKHIS